MIFVGVTDNLGTQVVLIVGEGIFAIARHRLGQFGGMGGEILHEGER